jgi:hypothetical protein
MTKQEFINKIDEFCNKSNIPLTYSVEHGLKIINNSINTNKVNVRFSKDNLTYDNLVKLSKELFTDPFIFDFIDDVYNKHNDNIYHIFIGISNNSKELYFEILIPSDSNKKYKGSSYGLSYDEEDGLIHSYKPFSIDKQTYYKHIINDFIEYIEKDNGLREYKDILVNTTIHNTGFIKDNKYFYLSIFKELQQDNLISFLKLLCQKSISGDNQLINDWFEQYKDGTLTLLSYRLEENKIVSLNLYIKQEKNGTRTN